MGTVLRQAVPPIPTAPAFVNPYGDSYAQAQAQANAPVAPTFTPEQVAQRKALNDQQYRWGMMGAMMGDDQQAKVGGTILQQALADRADRVTDKGVFNALTGQMNVNPEYAKAQAQAQLEHAGDLYQGAQMSYGDEQRRQAFTAQEQARQQAFERAQQGALFGQQNSMQDKLFGQQKELEGLKATAQARQQLAGPPSKEEADAAKFAVRMNMAKQTLDKFETPQPDPTTGQTGPSGRATTGTNAAASIPFIGNWAQNKVMSPEQQQYKAAQDLWLTANLRDESGAAIGLKEAEDDRIKFFPQPNDSDAAIAFKRQARQAAESGMQANAGRAWARTMSQYANDVASNQAPAQKLVITPVRPSAPAAPSRPASRLPQTMARVGTPAADPFGMPAPIQGGYVPWQPTN